MIKKHFDKNNLHHAYLIEGEQKSVVEEVTRFLKEEMQVLGGADLSHIHCDTFKIEDARNLKSLSTEKSFGGNKRIFIVCANNFLLEAQNTLLKMFEEPIEDTHFFVIVPDTGALLKTFLSRFYVISPKTVFGEGVQEAEKFLSLPLQKRLDFVKELIAEDEEESENSPRQKSLEFLNALEAIMSRSNLDIKVFEHIFNARKLLRIPGVSAKNVMESMAIVVPNLVK